VGDFGFAWEKNRKRVEEKRRKEEE